MNTIMHTVFHRPHDAALTTSEQALRYGPFYPTYTAFSAVVWRSFY